MKKKLILISLFLLSLSMIFAGSINDTIKNTQTPYVADKGGFDSLFINPAGMAGQTDAFNLSVFGTVTVPPNIMELLDTATALSDAAETGTITEENAEDVAVILAENLTQDDLDILLAGTELAGLTAEDLMDYDYSTLDNTELTTLTTQLESNQELALSAFDDVA
ncbi:MAG: hypothetical protein JEY99_19605 [Spirochaetales bacterium]|nr:hypothetical protein [Spirochaetales bacterium]